MGKSVKKANFTTVMATDWQDLTKHVKQAEQRLSPDKSEGLWFRGTDRSHQLTPTLMRDTKGHNIGTHDSVEQNLFFEFQAKSQELRAQNLTDWEYLFYSRHHGVPTRLLDWTDTFGVAVYFALEPWMKTAPKNSATTRTQPALWAMNPYALNERSWDNRDIVLPRYLGVDDDEEYIDYGDLLTTGGSWQWDGPVAVYPIQLGDRVRAQRGWFTIHGNNREPLEEQYPKLVWRIVLGPKCIDEGLQFLEWAGFNRYSIYPDFDNLATWLRQKNLEDLAQLKKQASLKRAPKRQRKKMKKQAKTRTR